jgi:ABC-type uncharacterized transport system involved in gliding motility auxiliary subunit
MNAIWTVARRELKVLFDHPTGYILLIVFVAVNDFLFFRQAELYGLASLRPMLELLPWMLLFLVPAVTMRALAEDARSGTLEVVLAQPLTELELLLGKYLGQVLFLFIALGLTFALPLGMALGANLQWGVVIAQYIGAAFLVIGLAGVGVWASSITPNQITAFIVGVAVTFLLILVGLDPLLVGLPPRLGALAQALGVLGHFTSIARGVIDVRDVAYFTSLAAAFLALAYHALLRRKLSPAGAAARRLRLGVSMLVAGAVLVSLAVQRVGLRIDLTPGNAYTLSPATGRILRSLPDLVTLKYFASRELPPEVAFLRRDIDDLLQDYRGAGRGNVRVVARDPSADTAALSEARALGIPPVQFNVVGRSELQVKEGWLGIAVQHAGETKTIPFVRQTDDLEYRLTSEIRALTQQARPIVGFAVVPDQGTEPGGFEALRQELARVWDVRTVSVSDTAPLSDSMRVMVALGTPDSLSPPALERFVAFVERGGSLLVMTSGMSVGGGQFASARRVGWNGLLRRYGVTIHSDLVYDLSSNEHVGLPTQFGRLLMPYPLWIRALSTKESPVNAELDGVLAPWVSSISLDSAPPGTAVPLFTTTRAAGVDEGFALLEPQREFRRDSLAQRVIAALVNPLAADTAESGTDSVPRGRIVVAGSAEIARDRFFSGSPENKGFVLNAVDWLAQDEALIAIRAKDRSPPQLAFTSPIARGIAKYGNLIGIPVLLVAVGGVRMFRRRRLAGRAFAPIEASQVAA